jgi:hypothetical protein
MLINTFKFDENKINHLLDELNEDRNKLFSDVKTSKVIEKVKEDKIKSIENIQRTLLIYKKLLVKEKEKDN